MRIVDPDEETRARYRRIIHAAKQHSLVPEGFHLRHTGRNAGDVVIVLSDDSAPDDTGWNRIRLNSRRVTTSADIVATVLDENPTAFMQVQTCAPRALDLLHTFGEVARRRGYQLGVNTKTVRPRLYLLVEGVKYYLLLSEEHDEVPHEPTDAERRLMRRDRWAPVPKTDRVPSGRLRLELSVRAQGGGSSVWADEKRSALEKRLAVILDDLERQRADEEKARLKAAQEAEERRARRELQEQQTSREWEAAKAAARPLAQEAARRAAFEQAYQSWAAAEQLREFCARLADSNASADGQGMPDGNLAAWIAWGRAQAEKLHPSEGPPPLSGVDFDAEPRPKELRPYMGKWSPDRPEHEYRSPDTQHALEASRSSPTQWHHGMIGRPSWWRHQR
jgi:hypothetical protein